MEILHTSNLKLDEAGCTSSWVRQNTFVIAWVHLLCACDDQVTVSRLLDVRVWILNNLKGRKPEELRQKSSSRSDGKVERTGSSPLNQATVGAGIPLARQTSSAVSPFFTRTTEFRSRSSGFSKTQRGKFIEILKFLYDSLCCIFCSNRCSWGSPLLSQHLPSFSLRTCSHPRQIDACRKWTGFQTCCTSLCHKPYSWTQVVQW